jgi:tripartite-type tricarboxylate transporter receptor subunit TctC
MKKLLLVLFVLISEVTFAEIPKQFNVYLPNQGGLSDQVCREIWNLYNVQYNSSAIINYKFGQGGVIAVKELIRQPGLSIGCTSSAEIVFNYFLYPNEVDTLSRAQMVVQTVGVSMHFYTGKAHEGARDLHDIIRLAKANGVPLKVGIATTNPKVMMDVIAKKEKINVTYINFKGSTDMLPSLIDGSLDLAVDAGVLLSMVDTGRIKFMGYISKNDHENLKSQINLQKYYHTAKLNGFLSISVGPRVDPQEFAELQRRLISILNSDNFKKFASDKNLTVLATTPEEAKGNIEHLKQATRVSWTNQQ